MEKTPHIFLDSNIFFTDPYLRKEFNNALVNLSNMRAVNLYITDVVYEEIINNYRRCVTDHYKNYHRAWAKLNEITAEPITEINIDIEREIKLFKSDLDDLLDSLIVRITFDPSDIQEVVHRSINHIKPFSKNKQEFRDCMIWLAIKKFVIENNLDHCYLLSANVRDFYNDSNSDLHPTLKQEIPNMIAYQSAKELILNVGELNKKLVEEELELWSYLNVKKEKIARLVYEDLFEDIYPIIEREIKFKFENQIVNFELMSLVQPGLIENVKIHSKDYKIIQDFSFFSCTFSLSVPTLFTYYEDEVEDYISREYVVSVQGKVHFTLKPSEKAQFNDLENLEFAIDFGVSK